MLRLILLAVLLLTIDAPLSADDTADPPPQGVDGFELPSLDGQTVHLTPSSTPTIVCFLGTECPLAKLYSPRIQQLAADQSSKVRVIGISSNRQDSIAELRSFAEQHEIKFEIAKDYQNQVADRFGATRTPEVFLLDADLNIVYRGRVDDQFSPGVTRAAAEQHFLRDALEQLLAGKPVKVDRTEPVGCLIGRVRQPVENSSVTYTQQISRLLQKHCIECHRAGEIGPFALTEYEEVVGWAEMMQEVMQQERMPPWHADPRHGEFLNARQMTDEEKSIFDQWIENGMPYGNQNELPPPRTFAQGWDLSREPDQVIEMGTEPYTIPASGIVEYQYFVVDPGFKEDKWVRAAQVLPGNRAVVHHSIVFVRPPDGRDFRGIGWLSAYVPGQRTWILPEGHARLVPAGSKLVFQQHYTPTGSVQTDMTRVGLIFADPESVKHEVLTVAGLNQEFEIPPLAASYEVQSTVRGLPKQGQLLSVSPHMHLRGKSFEVFNRQGDERDILCRVPAYDFNWQHMYIFQQPIELAEIGKLQFTATFDNSAANPFNPDPQQRVTWGDQTFEEMAVAFFDISVPRRPAGPTNGAPSTVARQPESDSPAVLEFVDKFFRQWDRNRDDVVERSEVPTALRGFGFSQYDANQDSKLSREEVLEAARRQFGRSSSSRNR